MICKDIENSEYRFIYFLNASKNVFAMTGDNEGNADPSNIAFFDLSSFAMLSTMHLPPSITTLQICEYPKSAVQSPAENNLVVILAIEEQHLNNEVRESGLIITYDWIKGTE
jgi:hypothetical protein